MKLLSFYYSIITFVLIIALPGCNRLVDWGKSKFEQGETRDADPYTEIAKEHIRSARVYDQFDTLAIFDSMWLSDEVKTAYTEVHAARQAKSEEAKQLFLRRELAENDHFISFYVLTYMPWNNNDSLGEKESIWSLTLKVNNKYYQASKIKSVEIDPDYRLLFGKSYNQFKTIYLVQFDAKDIEGNEIITPATRTLTLQFSTVDRSVSLDWHIDSEGDLVREKK